MDTHASETAIFEQLEKNLPPVFSREEAARHMRMAAHDTW